MTENHGCPLGTGRAKKGAGERVALRSEAESLYCCSHDFNHCVISVLKILVRLFIACGAGRA